MAEYVIVADNEISGECLIYICGTSKIRAEEVLHRINSNPNENDIAVKICNSNFRIKEIPSKDCWWNFGVD